MIPSVSLFLSEWSSSPQISRFPVVKCTFKSTPSMYTLHSFSIHKLQIFYVQSNTLLCFINLVWYIIDWMLILSLHPTTLLYSELSTILMWSAIQFLPNYRLSLQFNPHLNGRKILCCFNSPTFLIPPSSSRIMPSFPSTLHCSFPRLDTSRFSLVSMLPKPSSWLLYWPSNTS